jgi:hypothetical protein
MSFRLCSQILIGKYIFAGGVNEIIVKRSVKTVIDTAIITIPAAGKSANVKSVVSSLAALGGVVLKTDNNNALPTSIQTSTLWKEGDPVNILLGYNQDYRQDIRSS